MQFDKLMKQINCIKIKIKMNLFLMADIKIHYYNIMLYIYGTLYDASLPESLNF